MIDTIDLYEAIKQMRELSSQGKSFSFVHSTYNQDSITTNGIRAVRTAHLRPAAKGEDLVNADLKLYYFDEELQEPRNCWQLLLMYFNDQRIILN